MDYNKGMEWWMYKFFYHLSLYSLIFLQHKLWMITPGSRETEKGGNFTCLVICFVGLLGFVHTLNAALLIASRLTLKCCFHPSFPGNAEWFPSIKAPVCVCSSVVCAHTCIIYQKSCVFLEVDKKKKKLCYSTTNCWRTETGCSR